MSLEDAPVVARAIRNEVVESVHHGIGVITGPGGAVLEAVGNPTTPVFARSSNKPLQALAMLRSGLQVPRSHLALVCASHSGQPEHVAVVREMLTAAGLTEEDLQNTPDLPYDEAVREVWLQAGYGKAAVVQNCSGKHAGMLGTCLAAGWSIHDYRSPQHPLQQRITQIIEELHDAPVEAVGIDGCGAPVHQLPLQGLARAFGRLAASSQGPERQVAEAMRAHPELVGGTGREATDLMRALDGVIAKDGAEGVFAVGLPDGGGVAVKIVDGNPRASRVLLATLLGKVPGIKEAAVDQLADSPIFGHGHPVGRVVSAL